MHINVLDVYIGIMQAMSDLGPSTSHYNVFTVYWPIYKLRRQHCITTLSVTRSRRL